MTTLGDEEGGKVLPRFVTVSRVQYHKQIFHYARLKYNAIELRLNCCHLYLATTTEYLVRNNIQPLNSQQDHHMESVIGFKTSSSYLHVTAS
jgi:hypothetical protein